MKYDDLPAKTLLTPMEVAEFLSVDEKTVYRYVDTGMLTATKMTDKALRIYRHSIISLVEAGRTDRAETHRVRRVINRGEE